MLIKNSEAQNGKYWEITAFCTGVKKRGRRPYKHFFDLGFLPDTGEAPTQGQIDAVKKLANDKLHAEMKEMKLGAVVQFTPVEFETKKNNLSTRSMDLFSPRTMRIVI